MWHGGSSACTVMRARGRADTVVTATQWQQKCRIYNKRTGQQCCPCPTATTTTATNIATATKSSCPCPCDLMQMYENPLIGVLQGSIMIKFAAAAAAAKTLQHCARACIRVPQCTGFRWHDVDAHCALLNTRASSDTIVAGSPWERKFTVYNKRQDGTCCPCVDPPTSPAATTARIQTRPTCPCQCRSALAQFEAPLTGVVPGSAWQKYADAAGAVISSEGCALLCSSAAECKVRRLCSLICSV